MNIIPCVLSLSLVLAPQAVLAERIHGEPGTSPGVTQVTNSRTVEAFQLAQQKPQYKICTGTMENNNKCTIRLTNQTCPSYYMHVGPIYNTLQEVCADAKGRDTCVNGVTGC